ncbi:MAG TPA: cytochrome c oxidase assembly protein [Caulobacteraceae bacterium]
MPQRRPSELAHRNARLAMACAAVFLLMVGAAFAAVPFYRAFCQATGFNGTVKRVYTAQGAVSDKTVDVRFDTNVHGLSWRFEPVQPHQRVRLGAYTLAFFRATNTGDRAATGRAIYNVLPEWAGAYFSKLECFCFKNQTIAPGQSVDFPVVYTVDPRYANDAEKREAGQITLSYTFLPAVVGAGQTAAADQNARSALGARPHAAL